MIKEENGKTIELDWSVNTKDKIENFSGKSSDLESKSDSDSVTQEKKLDMQYLSLKTKFQQLHMEIEINISVKCIMEFIRVVTDAE